MEHYERGDSGAWTLRPYTTLTDSLTLTFTDTNIAIPLSHLYQGIPFPPTTDDTPAELP